jgi:hypothetical protein
MVLLLNKLGFKSEQGVASRALWLGVCSQDETDSRQVFVPVHY